MADVRGFRGLRYAVSRVGDLSRVVCPPYDVISPAEAAELRAASPYNAIHLELPEPGDASGATRYGRAAAARAPCSRPPWPGARCTSPTATTATRQRCATATSGAPARPRVRQRATSS